MAFTASGLPAEEDEGDTDTLLEDSSPLQGDPGQPRINAGLTVSQQTDLAVLLDEFNTTLSNIGKLTKVLFLAIFSFWPQNIQKICILSTATKKWWVKGG